ncbi:unnamed protein product [Rangifer tarandus platyrhynchus]|uniref:Uncharacterized protein n=1 Tax=Rangifer tarandus platyrhynchus TaxID=3082113 RepID=A0AC60A6B4_RANTA
MSKRFYFFKKVVQGGLGNDTFFTLWELVESWTSQNNWMAIFFIIFLGIIFEIILLKICTSFQKKPALPSEKDKSEVHKKEDNGSCLKSMKFDNWSALSSSEARVDDFSERTIASSITSERNEEYFEDSIPPPDEPPRASTSESRFRVSHFSESHMTSSNGTSSSSLSLFHSEVQEILLSCSGCPKNEHETIQFSSKKLFSIMKSNKNKNRTFSSDFNFSRTSRIIIESEDIDVAPCPPAHLFLTRDQVRLLEENVRNQSPSKSKATLENKITSLCSISLEPLIQNQHSATMDISPQAQASFSRQKAPQSQGFSKAQFTGEAHQLFNSQASVSRQPEREARHSAPPRDPPLSSSTQDAFQTLDTDRSQRLVQVPQSAETQESVKGLGPDTKHSDEAQDSVWSEDSNKIKYSTPGQDTVLKDARHLVLPPSPTSVAKVMPQLEHVKTEGQKQIAFSTLNQSPAYGSLPLMTRQKNRRERSRSKSELSLKDPPQKSKKTPASQVFQTTACHTAECRQLRYEHKTKKIELHQRKGVSGIALHFTYAFKLVPPYIRKYSRKRQAKFTPGLTECKDFLSKPDQSLCAEKVNYVGSVEEKGTTGSTESEEQHGRNNKELENISQEVPSQLEQSFMVNTYPQKVPCPPLIETNWTNKESLEDPKEMDMAESCAPNSKTTSDLPVARQETPLEEAISEPLKKCVSSPQMKSDRNMKTWEDLQGTEDSNPDLSSREELPTSVSEMQRCVSQGNTDRKDLEIVLESSDVNLFVSLGAKKHKSSGQPAGVEIQERPEDVTEKEKKALRVHVMEEDDISGSEELERSASSTMSNMQDERASAMFHEATHTALSLPPRLKMQSGLKTKMDTSEIKFSFSAVKPGELPDDREMYFSFEKNCLVKKPQEDDREEEQQAPQEAASQLTPGFRFSLQLQQKPTYVKLELGQSSSKGRTTQNKELDVHPQTVSTETTVGTSRCPTMDPLQGEVKQSTDRPTGRETADPVHPLTMLESLPVLTESTECHVPLGGSPEKSLDAQIAEEKQDLEGVLPEVALGSFHRHMPPLSNLKRKKIRKKIIGTTNVLSLKCVIMKVKKPPKCHRRRLRSNFKVMIKHILQDKTTAGTLLNVIGPHLSILPHVRMHSRLNVGNHSHTKLKQETSEAEREDDYSAITNKGSDSGNTLEAAQLQGDVSGDQEASPEAVLEDRWNRRLNEDPEKELKSMKEMQQLMTFAEIMAESILMATTGSVHVENMEKSLTAPADLRCTADDSEMSPPTSEKSLIRDPLNHTRESDVPDDGSDTRETGHCFAAMKAERPKDLPAVFPKTFNCHMPILSHSKVKKTRVRSSRIECRVNSKSVPMKTLKPSISQMCNITGHQRKKLKSELKAKFEKISQANGLEYEYLNTLYSPVHSRLQGETKSFCHVQAKLRGLAIEERPLYVDLFDESNALCDREEKVQDTEEKEQKTLQITAPQHTQYLWINGCRGKETHLAKPDAGLHHLTQEQDTQHQTCFKRAALQTDVQMGPQEAEELLKTNKPEDDLTAPAGLEVLPPEAGNLSPSGQGFIFSTYQEQDHDLIKSDEGLKRTGSINIQIQPQTHFAESILSSASCPTLDPFQLKKLESDARFFPPMSGEAKFDEKIFSAREGGVPSEANHQKEQAGGTEKEEKMTLAFCMAALSKGKRNFKQYSDMKILMNPKCRILKAKKPPISYMLNIKGGARRNRRKKLGYNLTTKMGHVGQGTKIADSRDSLLNIIPAINRYSDREGEEDMLGEKRLSSEQVKQNISPHKGNVTPDDPKEGDLQDEESEQKMLLKVIPQYSQHFILCSDQTKELELHKPGNKGCGKTLFVTKQDIPQHTQPADPVQATQPKRSQQTQNGTVWSASSNFPLLKLKESLTSQVVTDTVKCGIPSDESHMGELDDHEQEKSLSVGEAWEANRIDTQSRSSNTGRESVPHEREEENVPEISAESVPHESQHLCFTSHHVKNLGPCKSKPKLDSLEGRSTWNLSCAAQNMRQEERVRKTVLKPVSKSVMTLIQAQTLKKVLHTQEEIQHMADLKTPFPEARKSEAGSLHCGGVWDGNHRRKGDSPIFKKKARSQSDLGTVLKPLDFSSLDSSEPESQSHAVEALGKKSRMSPKQVTLEAGKLPVLQGLNSMRCLTGSHREKNHKLKTKAKEKQQNEGARETLFHASEGAKSPPPTLVTDKLPFDTAARDSLDNHGALHKNLDDIVTEKKAELDKNLATVLLGPFNLLMPVLSDSESQTNTVQEKITLKRKCSVMKKKESLISQLFKISRQCAAKQRMKLRSNIETKMKEMHSGRNATDTYTNSTYFEVDTPDIRRQREFQTEAERMSGFSPVEPAHMQLPVEDRVASQSLCAAGPAALSMNKEQKVDTHADKAVLNTDLKPTDASPSVPPHIKMEQLPSTSGNCEDSSEKRNALKKAKNSAYAYIPPYPQILNHQANAKVAGAENTVNTEQVKSKAKKPFVSLMYNTAGYGTRSHKKETRCNTKKQKPGFQKDKTEVEFSLKTICDSGSIPPKIQELMEAEREKGKPPRPKKSLNTRQIAFSQSLAKSAKSRNKKTLRQGIREQEENCQISSPDIFPQCRYRFMLRQQLKKSPTHVKYTVNLKREVHPDQPSPKRESCSTMCDISRVRLHTKHQHLTAPGVRGGDRDEAQPPMSAPQRTEVAEKTDVSLGSKRQNRCLPESDASQEKTCKEQDLLKEGSNSRTLVEPTLYSITETPHLENTIPNHLGRDGLRETDTFQGSKGQTFLCANAEVRQYTPAVEIRDVKPDPIPERLLDSASCPSRELIHVREAGNATGKESVSFPVVSGINLWETEMPKLTNLLLTSNEQKINCSEKGRTEQQNSSNQRKGNLLEFISSCILHQLHIERRKKEVSAKGMSSAVLSPVVQKASNAVDIPVDQPPCSGRKEHQQESTCKALPTSLSHSMMDIFQIKLPGVMKAAKEVDSPRHHNSNTEGIGLPVAESEEQPECVQRIWPNLASDPSRDILFQSKMLCEKTALEEVVSTVEYTPSTEGLGQLNIVKEESEGQIGKGTSGVKLTNLFASVPSLSPLDLNSRTKGGRDMSRIAQNCLPPLKLQATSNIRKASFAESINRESLSNIIGSKHFSQKKREDEDNTVYVKDKRGCKRATFKRKKKLFKHTPHGNELQWNNKEQEKMMQEDESDGNVVLNKPHASIPSSSHLEQGPIVKEAASQTVSWFCPPSLTLQELSDAVITCKEPADDNLSNIARSKHMSQKNKNKVDLALKEIRHPQRMPLEVNQSPVAQELQLNTKEKEEKIKQDKGKQVGIQRQSCVSISSPPYSEVDTRREGEAVMLRKTKSCFLQPKLQESSDMGNIAYEKSVSGDISNSVKKAEEHAIQEEEEGINMEKVLLLKKKNSPLSQEVQLDVEEQKKKIQRIQGEPSVILICTSRPATSFNSNTGMIGADDRAKVTRYSCSGLPHQISDAVKKANRESTERGIISDVQAANEFIPQKGEDQGETANMNYMKYSKETSSKAKEFPLPHVSSSPGSHSPQARDEPANRRENLGHAQEKKCELDEVLTGLCLPQFTLNKGEKEKQGALTSCLPPLWRRKSLDAQELKYTVSPLSEISSDSKRTKYMTQEEKDKTNVFVRDPMHPDSLALKVRRSPLFHMLGAKKLQVSIKEQVRRKQKGRRDTVVILSKICPFVTSSTHLKSDTIKEDRGGPGVLSHSVPHLKIQASRPSVQRAPPKSTDSKKEKQYLPPKERDRAHTTVVSGSVHASGSDFKAKTSCPPHVFGTAEHDALSRRKEAQPSMEECTEQGQGRAGDPGVTPTETPPALPSASDRRLDAGIKEDRHLPEVTGFSPPFQLFESSGAGKIRYADFSQGISSCNITVRANGRVSYKETEIRVKRRDEKDRTHPQITAVEAHTSPLTHLLSRNRLPLNVKEQGKEVQDGSGMVLRETRASLPSLSYLRQDASRNEKKDTERITQSCFPPLKIYDPLNLNTKADVKSFDGHLLKNKARLKTDNEDRVLPTAVHQKAKELPLSHRCDAKESQCKIKKQKKMVQREDSELVTRLKNICTSLLTLPYLKFDKPEGERYMIRITKLPPPQAESKESSQYADTSEGDLSKDVNILKEHMLQKEEERKENVAMNSGVDPHNMDLKAKESPIVLAHNLTDLSIREEGMSMLPRSSFPPVNFQKSSSSEEEIHVESMARDTVISPSREKYLPRNKKEDRVERRNFVSPKHQGKEMQESKDEPGMVLTKPSTPSPSLPALKLDKEVQVDDETLAPHRRSVLGRISKAEQMIRTYSISGDSRKGVQNEEQPIPEKEERDREKSVDRRGVTHTKYIILKSKKSPSSYTLHRSELYLNLGGTGQKKQETQGKPPGKVGRNIYLATPPTKPKLDKGTQVDEGKLGIEKPSLLPRMISELSDARKRTDTKGISDDVIKRKQCMSEKEKKLDVKNVDMRLRTHHKKSAISPIPDVFSTKKFVLNVIQEPGGKVHKDKDEPSMVLTRTFLSIPSAPLYLDLGSKTDKDTLGITGSSHPQQNLQETSDTQKTAITESAAGEREIVKNAERSAPEETMQQWTANFVLSVQQRRGPLQVKSEGGVSQLLSDSQQEDFYVTGHGTVKGGKRLESFFAGSEAQQKKYKPETLATILSFPMMGLTKIESLKKETEIMNDLSHKISPHVLVSLPRKLSKEIYATLGSPVSSEGFSASKQDVHHQEGALAQASPASTDLCKLDKPEEDRQNNRKTSEMSPPKVLAPQIKEPLEEVNITESDALQNADQEIVMKKQVVLQAGSGQKTRVDSSLSLKIPLQHVKQRTSLEIDVHKQTTVCPGIQMLPGIQMGMTEFDAQRGKKEQALLVPDKEAHNLELPQKSVSSWASPLQSGDVGRKSEAGTGSTGNLKQKKLEVKEGILKIDTNIAVHLEEDKIEMYKHTTVNLKEETIKMDTSNTVNLNTASLRAEEPQTETQVITPMANRCPTEQNHKKEREVSTAKHNIQLQKMPQKHALDSFYAYIPLSPKLGGQKGRLTIADLKRELSPKYLNMKIQKHPILQILGNTGRGTPSNRKKLEYNFNKSKKIDLRRGDASEIFIRSLSISTVSPSQTKEPVKSWTNLESVKRTCISEFQKNSPNTSETMKRNSSSIVKEGNQNFANTVPQDSQPFMVDKQQMHKVPNIKSEANLSSEINKNLAPQTNKRVVPEKGNSGIIKEADVLMTKQEKAPKPIETPTGCLIMSEDPKEYVERTRNQSEPVQDIAIQKVQRQETSLGTVPIQPQVKGSERNTVGYSPSAGIMIPLCEAIKNFLESQIKNMIQNRFFPKNLEKVKDNKPDDWNSQLFTRGLSTLSMTLHPELQPKPILENFTCKEKIKLRNHLESKAPEIRLNLIPEVVKRSFQRFSFYKKLAISKHNSWKLYPRHKQMFFSPLEGIDTVEFNLKHKYEKDSPPASCMKSLIVNVSRGSEEAVNITKLKRMKELESGVPSLTSAREKTLPHILQNCSVGEKNKLLIHFSKKTLEIQMKAFPRIVRESYTMANAQDRRKPLSKCVHSVVKVPKRKNRVLLLFEENSLHQIDLDLQYKYFRFLLGSPVAWMFPKPTAFPKHTLKLQTVAICEKGDNSGESGSHSIDTQPLEHIPFKKQSFHEDTSLVRNFLAPTQVCALDPDQHSMVQKDTMALSKLKSHVTPEKDKQCHVWFQETNTYESVDLKIQKKAQDVGGSHSIQNSEDFTDSQTDIENSDNLEECSAHDVHDSEDCIFLDATPYLSQEAESILFELQKGIPVENLYKKVKMGLKPLYSEDVGSHHIRGHRQHSSIVTPHSYEPHKSRTHGSRKRGWSSKMQPPDPWCHSSLNTVELPSVSSSISFNGEMLSQTTVSGNNYSLVPLTESNIKLHLAKSQGKPHRHSESRERRKAKLDFFRKNNMPWECDDSYTKSKQKHTRRKNVRDYESERLDYFPSKYKSSAKPHQEDISFHSEKKQNQPFFYACIPADSLEIIPQTIRWTVPPKTVRKRNFRVPLVAKISTSYSIWNSSKKLLGSLLESFSLLH